MPCKCIASIRTGDAATTTLKEHGTDVTAVVQEVQRSEAVSAQANTKEAVQQREQAHQAALMPRVFDGLRSLFGNQGPCTKPMAEASPSHQLQIVGDMDPCQHLQGCARQACGQAQIGPQAAQVCIINGVTRTYQCKTIAGGGYMHREACLMTSAMQVVEALSKARGHAMAAADMEAQLRALQGAIPEYLTIQPGRQGPGVSIRVNRRADISSLRTRLLTGCA